MPLPSPCPQPISAGSGCAAASPPCADDGFCLWAVAGVGSAGNFACRSCSLLEGKTLFRRRTPSICGASSGASLEVNVCTATWSLALRSPTASQRGVVRVQCGSFLCVTTHRAHEHAENSPRSAAVIHAGPAPQAGRQGWPRCAVWGLGLC